MRPIEFISRVSSLFDFEFTTLLSSLGIAKPASFLDLALSLQWAENVNDGGISKEVNGYLFELDYRDVFDYVIIKAKMAENDSNDKKHRPIIEGSVCFYFPNFPEYCSKDGQLLKEALEHWKIAPSHRTNPVRFTEALAYLTLLTDDKLTF